MLSSQARLDANERDDASAVNEPPSNVVASVEEVTPFSLKTRLPRFENEQTKVVTQFPTRATSDQPSEVLTLNVKSDPQKAFRLLDDVKTLIPKMLAENDSLKRNLTKLKSEAEMEIEATEARLQNAENANGILRSQVETLEAMVLDLRGKLQKSEGLVAIEKELSSKVGQEAAEAECLAKLFEDTVISSFGNGTMFQDALTRIQPTAK